MEPAPDERDLLGALECLGHRAFRPGQREIIEAVLGRRDAVAIMPTGGGKSLCFQLPALLLRGVSVVVSPLIALMRDQVATLQARGIAATFINSSLSPAERDERQRDLGRYRLVYVAPERFRSPRFLEALGRVEIGLFAVDEAHCISEWGHDFRPDYRRLGELVERLRPPRLLALTATATPEVRGDIVTQLRLREPHVFVHGFDRPNLDLLVERAGGEADKLERALAQLYQTPSGVAIVYTATRKKAEAVARGLADAGLSARPYHAGLPDEERRATESAFLGGELPVIVATNAFGMGIDKRDVRLVLHHDLPRSPEAYYQEMGRAGRDGERARCVLLFNPGDARVQEFLIDQSAPDPGVFRRVYGAISDLGPLDEQGLRAALPGIAPMQLEAALTGLWHGRCIDDDGSGYRAAGPLSWDEQALRTRQEHERLKLRRMVTYGYSTACRMRFFLDYFGDHFRVAEGEAERTRCGYCDNCRRGAAAPLTDEEHTVVRKALAGVARLDGRFGKRRVAEVLHGSLTKEAERAGLDRLSTFGLLKDRTLPWLCDLLSALEEARLIGSSGGEYPTIHLLPPGREVMHDRARADLVLPDERTSAGPAGPGKRRQPPYPKIHARAESSGAGKLAPAAASSPGKADDEEAALSAAEAERFERLRRLRAELAREEKVAPFIIFHDRTLRALARACPRDPAALAQVSGIGKNKLSRYGARVLRTLSEA